MFAGKKNLKKRNNYNKLAHDFNNLNHQSQHCLPLNIRFKCPDWTH
jgi:hypothetical protein